jgi:hypothetical protein
VGVGAIELRSIAMPSILRVMAMTIGVEAVKTIEQIVILVSKDLSKKYRSTGN